MGSLSQHGVSGSHSAPHITWTAAHVRHRVVLAGSDLKTHYLYQEIGGGGMMQRAPQRLSDRFCDYKEIISENRPKNGAKGVTSGGYSSMCAL